MPVRLLARLRSALLPLALWAGAAALFYFQNLRLSESRAKLIAANAEHALTRAAYDSAVDALDKIERESRTRAGAAAVVFRDVEKVRVEVREKLVYIESEPPPATCPDAIDYLAKFGADFERGRASK
ncbi:MULTISPECIES: hypothetical protein [Delftia]|uniref:Uncharacterized protein n=1 Tax=Delftia lacustris TaxID=558537 RepID=A0A7T2YS80_9BURK|nr:MULTISPECIES: hypothetical protein [Delftia]QPS80919.1 hypothetical protein I6G47_28760 [Delftia lacustris]